MTTPQASAASSEISRLVQQILNIVKNGTYGNQAIKNAIDSLQGSVNGIDLSNLDATVSSRASQASVIALQSDVDALASGGINDTALLIAIHCDTFLASPLDAAFCDLQNANLSYADLSNASLHNANLDGAVLVDTDFTGCLGDPVGTPAMGTLPDCL